MEWARKIGDEVKGSRSKVTKASGGWDDGAQLAECMTSMHEALGLVPIIGDAYCHSRMHREPLRLARAT